MIGYEWLWVIDGQAAKACAIDNILMESMVLAGSEDYMCRWKIAYVFGNIKKSDMLRNAATTYGDDDNLIK